MDKSCVFCQIVQGNRDAVIIYEDRRFIAFLDKSPLFQGHCLLIPKKHVPTLYDLPPALVKPLFLLAQKIGKAIEKATQADGSFIAINNTVSQSVPHLHIHLIPRNFQDGLRGFFWPRTSYASDEHSERVQSAIKRFIAD